MVAEILSNHFRSVAIIGMGKNTGKTFTFNYLAQEARRMGIKTALTTIGLDGEERDSLFGHAKPSIPVWPGVIAATARGPLTVSGLDYEVLATTDLSTPLGEVVLAQILSWGKLILAGPSSGSDLLRLKELLDQFAVDLLLVDGAVDRRSLSAPLVTDTAVLAVGVEAAWERSLLLNKVAHQLRMLTLPGLDRSQCGPALESAPPGTKLILVKQAGEARYVSQQELQVQSTLLADSLGSDVVLLLVQGILTDSLGARILGAKRHSALTVAVVDPTHVFLSPDMLAELAAAGILLKVLDPIQLTAVTVNPFHSRRGQADPKQLLEDVGRVVHPLPCLDLRLGVRFRADEEEIDALP